MVAWTKVVSAAVKLERRGEIQEQYDIETELKDGEKWERIRVEEEI